MKDAEAAGCDVKTVRGELAGAWMRALPFNHQAHETVDRLGTVCDYAAALAKARAFQNVVTDDPWPRQQIPVLEAGARAEAEINRLIGEVSQGGAGERFHQRAATHLANGHPRGALPLPESDDRSHREEPRSAVSGTERIEPHPRPGPATADAQAGGGPRRGLRRARLPTRPRRSFRG